MLLIVPLLALVFVELLLPIFSVILGFTVGMSAALSMIPGLIGEDVGVEDGERRGEASVVVVVNVVNAGVAVVVEAVEVVEEEEEVDAG